MVYEKGGREMKVFKYIENMDDIIEIDLPTGAQILHVNVQDDYNRKVCIWALIDESISIVEKRRIRIAGTGHLIDVQNRAYPDGFISTVEEQLKYINTFTMCDRDLWFHTFELKYMRGEEYYAKTKRKEN